MNWRATRQRISVWLVFDLPPNIMFHRPSRSTVVTAASAIGLIDVEAGKLALEKSQNTEVRAFAQRMVGDHTAVNYQALSNS